MQLRSNRLPRLRLSVLGCIVITLALAFDSSAAIDAYQLGARYDGTQSNITFKVYSARATRIEVWIYKNASGFQEKVNYVMTKDAGTNVWSKTASVATLQNTYGITGTV